MYRILILSALLLSSLTYSAARIPARGPAEEKKQKAAVGAGAGVGAGYERKEKAADEVGKEEAVTGGTGVGVATPGQKVVVSSLGVLAAEQLLTTIDKKAIQEVVDELVRVWISSPAENDFVALLGRSHEIIDTLFPAQLSSKKELGNELSNVLYAPIILLLLQNPAFMAAISTAPLFAPVGRWPSPIDIRDIIFNQNGYIAADSRDALYIFNCAHRTMLPIPHPIFHSPLGFRSSLHIAYDGSAVARTVPSTMGDLTIFDSTSGTPLHSVQGIRNFSASPVSPLFMYSDRDRNNAIMYDCATKKVTTHTIMRNIGENSRIEAIKTSPRGTFSAYEAHDITRADRIYFYIQNNNTQQLHLLLQTRWPLFGRYAFNNTESMILIEDKAGIKIFKTDTFTEVSPDIGKKLGNNVSVEFSPDGTQLLVSSIRNGSASIYDLNKEIFLETFSKAEAGGNTKFVSQDILLLVPPAKSGGVSQLYLRDTRQKIVVGLPVAFSEKSKQLAYKRGVSDLYFFNMETRQGCVVRKVLDKKHSDTEHWGIDTQGTLFCVGQHNIEQLMIDPIDCSLNQIFFLLGLVRASRGGTPDEVYKQLLASPLLTTFSPIIQAFLIAEIEKIRSRFTASVSSPKKEEPKKVASARLCGNNNKKRMVA